MLCVFDFAGRDGYTCLCFVVCAFVGGGGDGCRSLLHGCWSFVMLVVITQQLIPNSLKTPDEKTRALLLVIPKLTVFGPRRKNNATRLRDLQAGGLLLWLVPVAWPWASQITQTLRFLCAKGEDRSVWGPFLL